MISWLKKIKNRRFWVLQSICNGISITCGNANFQLAVMLILFPRDLIGQFDNCLLITMPRGRKTVERALQESSV